MKLFFLHNCLAVADHRQRQLTRYCQKRPLKFLIIEDTSWPPSAILPRCMQFKVPISLHHIDLTLEIMDDPAFTRGSDSPTKYDKVIEADEDKEFRPTSQHAVKIYRSEILLASAIILAAGGGTCVHEGAAFVDGDNLIIRCCNKLFCLTLPELEVNWMVPVDWATCFSVHKYKDTYISHGEISIARIDRTGTILWSYDGSDIFICLDGRESFEIHEEHLSLIDFKGSTYKIDFNGNTIEYNGVA